MNPRLQPSQFVVDFEKASINAFPKLFNKVTIKGCFFHFAQANWPDKIQMTGLASVYREDKKTRMLLKLFVPLALIPELDFEIGITASCSDISDHGEESPLSDLIWLRRILKINFGWNHPPRTQRCWAIPYFTLERVRKRKKGKQITNTSMEG